MNRLCSQDRECPNCKRLMQWKNVLHPRCEHCDGPLSMSQEDIMARRKEAEKFFNKQGR